MQSMKFIFASLHAPSRLALAASLIWVPLALGVSAPAQTSEQVSEPGTPVAAPIVPQQVRYAGKLASRSGDTVEAVFSIYADQEGGEPLWTETQKVAVDADGSYVVLLGSATQNGLPQTLFAGGAARWLGVAVERAQEQPRVLLSSVPYAMKSADAQALAGHPVGDFVTQAQLSQFAQNEAQRMATNEFQPLTSGAITGSGTAGNIAQFTGANTIGNSLITQTGSMIGVNEASPVSTLDVNGGGQFRGILMVPAKGVATTSASQPSQYLEFASSGWSTTTAGPVTPTFFFYNGVLGNNTANPEGEIQLGYLLGSTHTDVLSITGTGPLYAYGGFIAATTTLATTSSASNSPPVQMNAYAYSSKTSGQVSENFAWQVIPTGNDTTTPSANLNLLYGTGSTSPTGLSISSKGIINWATGQTFPGTGAGTITGITTSSPLTGSGTSGSVALGLNESTLTSDITPSLETTFNSIYPQLSTSNTFTSGASFGGPITASATVAGTSAVTATGTNGADGISASSDTANAGNFANAATGYATIYGSNTASFDESYIPVALNATASGTQSVGAYGAGTSAGVAGASNGGPGVWGISGVLNSLPSVASTGVLGQSSDPAPGNSGVLGFTGSDESTSYSYEVGRYGMAGVWGDTTGNPTSSTYFSAGVMGTTDASDGYGGVFIANSATTDAMFAKNLNSGAGLYAESLGVGVNGSGQGTGGTGVEGFSPSPSEGQAGVLGYVYQLSGTYSTFETTGPVGFVAGVWGDSGEVNDGTETYTAGVVGTGDDITAGVFENNSSLHPTISVVNQSSGGTGLFTTLQASTPDSACGFGSGGDLNCTGRVKALVNVGGDRKLETYSVQSPENWMEDFGSGELKNGVAVINIDPAFAQTVTADGSYHVFITPNGDSEALYVINKTATSFEVRESKGGTSSLSFDYRIVGKRRGYEAQRLVDVTERYNAELARAMPITNAIASRRVKPVRPSMTSPGMAVAPGGITVPRKASTVHVAPLRIGAGRTPVAEKATKKPASTPEKH